MALYTTSVFSQAVGFSLNTPIVLVRLETSLMVFDYFLLNRAIPSIGAKIRGGGKACGGCSRLYGHILSAWQIARADCFQTANFEVRSTKALGCLDGNMQKVNKQAWRRRTKQLGETNPSGIPGT